MTALDALSRTYGIQDSVVNASGQEVITTSEAKLAMLAAMGVEASNEGSALCRFEGARRCRMGSRDSTRPGRLCECTRRA
jgi:hypothetical protein